MVPVEIPARVEPAGVEGRAARAARRLTVGAAGLVCGGLFLWLALRATEPETLYVALRGIDPVFVLLSLALYWVGLALRVGRWRILLLQLSPLTRREVAELLLVGYAVNNLLPARLGELFRADYAKRRTGLSRAKVLGSIVVERAADLTAILGCLVVGLLATGVAARAQALAPARMLLSAGALCGAVGGGLWLARRGALGSVRVSSRLRRPLDDLGRGLRALNRDTVARVLSLTLSVWIAEVGALWAMLVALGVTLGPTQALFVMGAASLSTLVPTAPAYLGTYQFVFATALALFGSSAAHGVLASTLIQLALFGPVTVTGLVLYFMRSMHNMRPNRNEALLGGSDLQSR